MNIQYKQETFGKILFIISIAFLIFTTYVGFTKIGLWGDEIFSFKLIQYPLSQMFYYIVNDVHPPLYYLIYKFLAKIFIFLHISNDYKIIGKFLSLLPMYLLFILSFIKIRKNFNWLTLGIFTLTVISMPQLMNFSVELRMYSLSLFFITSSFIYAYEVINNEKNIINWIILTIMAIGAIYTHYYCIIIMFLIYLYVFYKLFKNNKDDIKIWLLSTIFIFISYMPWINVLIQQTLITSDKYWIPPITFKNVIDNIFFILSPENKIIYGTESPVISIFGILLLISILVLIFSYFRNKKDNKSNFAIVGLLITILIPAIGFSISLIKTPIYFERYLVPALGIFWLSISILLGQNFDNKKIFIPIIIVILICSFVGSMYFYDNQIEKIENENKFINSTNNIIKDDDILIIEGKVSTGNSYFYFLYDYYLGNTEIIPLNPLNEKNGSDIIPDINSIIESNKNKKIYIITYHLDDVNNSFNITNTSRSVIFEIN